MIWSKNKIIEQKYNEIMKFIFLILLGVWNIILTFFLIPLFLAYLVGVIIFEENVIPNISLSALFLFFFYFLSMIVFWRKKKEYKRIHILAIVVIIYLLYLTLKYSVL